MSHFLKYRAGYWRYRLQVLLCLTTLYAFFSWSIAEVCAADSELKKCLIVASYHDGFKGQALKIEGARSVLEGNCEIRQFNMDTKRNPAPEFCRNKAMEIMDLITDWHPDVLIAIDDNASRYLVEPFLKNAALPVVFAGLDWTASEYGYPYANATGIIEVVPIIPLIHAIKEIVPDASTAVCLRGERLSEKKDCERYRQVYKTYGIEVADSPVASFDEFQQAFLKSQNADVVIVQNYSGIAGWDDTRAEAFVREHTRTLTVSQLDWMARFTILSFTQIIQEQGIHAAQIALKILAGASPRDFPIVANRQWDILVNMGVLKKTGLRLPYSLIRKAHKIE